MTLDIFNRRQIDHVQFKGIGLEAGGRHVILDIFGHADQRETKTGPPAGVSMVASSHLAELRVAHNRLAFDALKPLVAR